MENFRMRQRYLNLLASGLVCLMVTSCTSTNTSALSGLKQVLGFSSSIDNVKLNPAYRYLRISISGRVSYVALGDIDKNPESTIEVYYGGGGEVLRFQHGRLAGATGLVAEWRNVFMQGVPSWTNVAMTESGIAWRRVRDVMPAYRHNLEEQVLTRRTPSPRKSEITGTVPDDLTWFEEQVLPSTSSVERLPLSRYAVSIQNNVELVVYGEQCVSTTLCIAWQQWIPGKSTR
jgi:hypothetical protein